MCNNDEHADEYGEQKEHEQSTCLYATKSRVVLKYVQTPLSPNYYYSKAINEGGDKPRGNVSICIRNPCRLLRRVLFWSIVLLFAFDTGLFGFGLTCLLQF